MEREQAQRNLDWWMSQALDWHAMATTPGVFHSRYNSLTCLQYSAEFMFKAVINSGTGLQMKTRDPYVLIKHAEAIAPAINSVFPCYSPFEKKIFHFLKPTILIRGSVPLLPNDEEMETLAARIKELQRVVAEDFERRTLDANNDLSF
jgi:hypothetical protein